MVQAKFKASSAEYLSSLYLHFRINIFMSVLALDQSTMATSVSSELVQNILETTNSGDKNSYT